MPRHVIVDIGETQSQAAVAESNEIISTYSWSQGRDAQLKGLSEWLQTQNLTSESRWLTTSRLGHARLKKRLGSSVAILVTSGFADWLDLHRQPEPPEFRLEARRTKSFIEKDLIFEVGERLAADGSIEKPLDMAELEFLTSKLQLLEVKNIAICFLHSLTNPQHEVMVANFLREKGFRVVASHQMGPQNEPERWLSAALSLYLYDDWVELGEACRKVATELGLNQDRVFFETAQGPQTTFEPEQTLSSLFGWHRRLKTLQSHKGWSSLVHLGLESFVLIHANSEDQSVLESPFGRLALTYPAAQHLSIQPTQTIEISPWGNLSLTHEEAGLEPGPMCWGRGSTPYLLDVLWANHALKGNEDFNGKCQSKMDGRIREHLAALTRSTGRRGGMDAQAALSEIQSWAARKIVAQVVGTFPDHVVWSGPLASALKPTLEKIDLSPRPECTWLSSQDPIFAAQLLQLKALEDSP